MKPRASLLLGALLAFATGCAHPAPLGSPATHVLAPHPNHTRTTAEAIAGVEPNRLAELAAPVTAPATATCRIGVERGANGLYATDPREKGEVVLTFDDGPHPKGTPRVLDLLAEHHMPATFFVVGRAISRDTYPLVQRIVAEGHTLGSHSYGHDVHMIDVHAPERSRLDVLGQHEVTTQIVDLALLATSGDDFDAMFRRVYQHDPATWLAASTIRSRREAFAAAHRALLESRGFASGARPYDVIYSRPPGGGPYVEHDGAEGIALHDAALAQLSLLNVMWHGASGDTDPAQRADFAFLTSNMEKIAQAGGVLLVHDYIRPDALAHSLGVIAARPDLRVVPIGDVMRRKLGCEAATFAATRGAKPA